MRQKTLLILFRRPYYTKGCAIGCGFTGAIVLLSLGLYFALRASNSKKDEKYGKITEDVDIDVTDLGDSHPQFRYLT